MVTFEAVAAISSALCPISGKSCTALVSKVSPRVASSVGIGGVDAETVTESRLGSYLEREVGTYRLVNGHDGAGLGQLGKACLLDGDVVGAGRNELDRIVALRVGRARDKPRRWILQRRSLCAGDGAAG